MNPSTLARIHTFTDEILRPAFSELEQQLKTQTPYRIIIVSDANTGTDEVDALLQQMHSGTPYLTQIANEALEQDIPSSIPQQWIGDSLYIGILQDLETESRYVGQYCLSIAFTINTTEEIQLTSILGCTQPSQTELQLQNLAFENDQLPQELEKINKQNIILHFFESFEDFETQTLTEGIRNIEAPEPDQAPAIDLNSQPNLLDTPEQPISSETPSGLPQAPAPAQSVAHPFTLKQQVKDLTNQLSPRDFPIVSNLNLKLKTPFQIKTLKNRYGQNTDLILEYSLSISEADLKEQLSRLGHYESLRSLVHQHIFIQEQMQAWIKQNNQPSPGAIASHLSQSILQLRHALERRITTLLDHQLKNLTAAELETEFNTFNAQQQHQQAIFKQIDQNAVLGYLDISLLEQDEIRQPHLLFTNPYESIQIPAQHLKNRDEKIILTLIASCKNEKYQTYLLRKQQSDEQNLFIGYTITQKLYPNRPVFIGQAPKAVFPRLECLWDHTDEPTMKPNPLTQIWCIYPMIRTDPPQWIVIAATTDQKPLQTITLENGVIAQEGTAEYLGRSLNLMAQSEDEYTHSLAGLLREALVQKRVKYLHVHQTWDPNTDKPRDIIQMQFQLFR